MLKTFIKKKFVICFLLFLYLLNIFLIGHRSNFNSNLILNFYKKDYGYEESIKIYSRYHAHAKDIRNFVKKYNINEFSIDDKLLGDPFIFESSYPSKYNKKSKYFFSKKSKNNCALLESTKNINLYKCS